MDAQSKDSSLLSHFGISYWPACTRDFRDSLNGGKIIVLLVDKSF